MLFSNSNGRFSLIPEGKTRQAGFFGSYEMACHRSRFQEKVIEGHLFQQPVFQTSTLPIRDSADAPPPRLCGCNGRVPIPRRGCGMAIHIRDPGLDILSSILVTLEVGRTSAASRWCTIIRPVKLPKGGEPEVIKLRNNDK